MRDSRCGIQQQAVAKIAHVRTATIQDIADGRREFSSREVSLIERACNRTGGELAALVLDPTGGALAVASMWADYARKFECRPVAVGIAEPKAAG